VGTRNEPGQTVIWPLPQRHQAYYLTDANMNVTCLADDAGAAVERYAYDPYGRVTIRDGTTGGQTDWAADADQKSDVGNDVLFCGYRRDAETGLYHVRHRGYHPRLGRWMQRDPHYHHAGAESTSPDRSLPPANLSEYVRGGPTSFVDPLGLELWYPSGPCQQQDPMQAYQWELAYDHANPAVNMMMTRCKGVRNKEKHPGGCLCGLIAPTRHICVEMGYITYECCSNGHWVPKTQFYYELYILTVVTLRPIIHGRQGVTCDHYFQMIDIRPKPQIY